MFKNLDLKEGMFVSLTGMKVKNDNDIFIVDCDYNIKDKYAVCHNEYCLKKIKLDGTLSAVKYNIVFLNDNTLKTNPDLNIKIVTDLKQAKKEVREYLKNREAEETIITFKPSKNNELQHNCIIKFKEGLKFGVFGEKYISKNSLYLVKLRENKGIYIEELGKKGQTISNPKMYGCTIGLTEEIKKVSEVVEKMETKKSDVQEGNKQPIKDSTDNIHNEAKENTLINKKFGKWIVIKELEKEKGVIPKVLCRCECGKEKVIVLTELKNGRTKSCKSCANTGKKLAKDLSGKKFGNLTVIKRIENKGKRVQWLCICNCIDNNEIKATSNELYQGIKTDCGCSKLNKYDLTGNYGIGWTINSNKEFYFDLEDYEKIRLMIWNSNNNYIVNREQNLMHRIIMDVTDDNVVDHINHKEWDNRKENLRICTQHQNTMNKKIANSNKTGITGVIKEKKTGKWYAYITFNYKKIGLGRFDNVEDAIKSRKEAEEKYFGEYKNIGDNDSTKYKTLELKVNFNKEKEGIELKFNNKPSQEIIQNLKTNKFKWSHKKGFWYAKDTKERREFLKSIGFLENNNNSKPITVEIIEENLKEVEYAEIDINDIENYTVSEELSKRENDISMFRSKDTNHTKELQNTLQSAINDVIELCNMKGCTPYIEYKAKTYLQSFKKKYRDAYISVLTHRANNPSWCITGRSGLNINKYNKKQDHLTNKMKYECQLIDEFNDRIEQYKNRITREQQQKAKANFETLKANTDTSNIKFKRTKTDNINGIKLDYTCTVYEYNDHFIVSSYWGKFRIYNSIGKELTSCNSLEDAKITLITLINQEEEKQQKAI